MEAKRVILWGQQNNPFGTLLSKSVWMMNVPFTRRERKGRPTHPKCCTTLGSMPASWSMVGYWYLWRGEVKTFS